MQTDKQKRAMLTKLFKTIKTLGSPWVNNINIQLSDSRFSTISNTGVSTKTQVIKRLVDSAINDSADILVDLYNPDTNIHIGYIVLENTESELKLIDYKDSWAMAAIMSKNPKLVRTYENV